MEEILEAFGRARIEGLVLKGMALAGPVWEDPALRPMDDIDVLVHREDARRAAEAAAALGYETPPGFEGDLRRRAAARFVPPAAARSARPPLDLHWDLVDDRYGPGASRWAGGVWERAREFPLGTFSARALSPADSVIHACVHLAVHHGLLGLLWHCDLALMARAWREEIEWESLVERVADARLTGAVWGALVSAEATVGLDIPGWVLPRLRPRAPRTRVFVRWLLPRVASLRSVPYQEYVVPLFLMDRGRDVAALVLRRILRGGSGRSPRQDKCQRTCSGG